jgi:hypothetical protein
MAALLTLAACGGKPAPNPQAVPEPTRPLPLAALASVKVPVLPLGVLAFDDSLRWVTTHADLIAARVAVDSILGNLLQDRAHEVTWILPEELRRQAHRSPTFAKNPDQMGTVILRGSKVGDFLPDPLRSDLRALVAIADARHALVPVQLVYRRMAGSADGRMGTAELTVVIVDARLGQVGFKTVARGDGTDPWTALTRAVKALTPGLP